MGWGITLNRQKAARWLWGLAAWVVFVLGLAAVRRDLNPTWAEIGWLIGPAVAYVAACLCGSFLLAYIKAWVIAWNSYPTAPRTGWLRLVRAPAARDCARKGQRLSAGHSGR